MNGFYGFLITSCLVFFVILGSSFLDELLMCALELRKGFLGTKASPIDYFRRQIMRVMRSEGEAPSILRAALKCTVILLAAAMIPNGIQTTTLEGDHSLWTFGALMLVTPLLGLSFQWIFSQGMAWPMVLRSAERSLGAITSIVVLFLTVITLFGADSLSTIQKIQAEKGWFVFFQPLSVVVLAAFIVVTHFLCFQTVFKMNSRDYGPEGMHLENLSVPLQRATWSLVAAAIFLGGAQPAGSFLGTLVLAGKAIGINLLGSFLFSGMFRLNELQAENLILWKMVPIGIFVYLIAILIG